MKELSTGRSFGVPGSLDAEAQMKMSMKVRLMPMRLSERSNWKKLNSETRSGERLRPLVSPGE
jgi:hypothetical protein